MKSCPCCSGKEFSNCCARFINGQQFPQTPEELMRSRYTAYTQANVNYIADTMKSPAADHFNANEAKQWAQQVQWNKLEVVKSSISGDKGFVEFLAQFIDNGNQQILHERSEFHKINDKWFYVDGERTPLPVRKLQEVGRNDACPCGSGKKYKKCCGK